MTQDLGHGVVINPYCHVDCLTPNSWPAPCDRDRTTGAGAYEIELMEVDASDPLGMGGDPWGAGVHLFSVSIEDDHEPWNNYATTIATAVIDDRVPRLDRDRFEEVLVPVAWAAFRERRVGWP